MRGRWSFSDQEAQKQCTRQDGLHMCFGRGHITLKWDLRVFDNTALLRGKAQMIELRLLHVAHARGVFFFTSYRLIGGSSAASTAIKCKARCQQIPRNVGG